MSYWGKGVNNNIGWGQGANNDIGWGSIYDKSNAGQTLLERLDLLLNKFSGASLGLSLMKLDKNYTGSCINVRRSSDNFEQDIGFVNGVLDTASLLDFVGSGNGFVTIWYDQSGIGNNSFQTLASGQPQIVDNGSVILENGKPSMSFNGISQFLTKGIGNSLDYSNNNIFAFAVNRASTRIGRLFCDDKSGIQGFFTNQFYESSGSIQVNDGDGYKYTSNTGSTINIQSLSTFGIVGTSGVFVSRQNGTLLSSSTLSVWNGSIGTSGEAGFAIGASADGSQFFTGKIQEVILYTANQTSNLSSIENNINARYNIY